MIDISAHIPRGEILYYMRLTKYKLIYLFIRSQYGLVNVQREPIRYNPFNDGQWETLMFVGLRLIGSWRKEFRIRFDIVISSSRIRLVLDKLQLFDFWFIYLHRFMLALRFFFFFTTILRASVKRFCRIQIVGLIWENIPSPFSGNP